ncbi:hypothetical protein YN1551_3208 (plasmid) [Sulfolobus islandicus Y.N.15.51]|uniref:Uncharacterized protein n=1 Tax=Saccharolobus islandicus (strain Y.N.15.51 / Yellowstone \|nr:hypothetical protein [Sulfolobus islandicus]ACP50082.1 hypothetical protein YN1551_3208 [Sulfolobus islandicus Y.N.15.51]
MKLRELTVGWLYTTSGIDEKSFPIGIKNVNMKELLVIFPLLILTISFAFKNIMIAMAFIAPVFFFVFYEEKSMDEFQYIYHFLRFYLNDFLAPKEEKNKKESKKKVKTFDIKKFKDEIIITASALLALTNVNAFINTFQLKFYYPTSLSQDLLFAVGTGVAIGFIISKIRK